MIRKRSHKKRHPFRPGTAPGTLVAPIDAQAPSITVIAYDDKDNTKKLFEAPITKPEEVIPLIDQYPLLWINIDGLADVSVVEGFGKIFKLHPLALEDVLNMAHRPKAEDFGEYLFIVTRMITPHNGALEMEQVSIFVGPNFVLSFQEHANGDCLDALRNLLRNGAGRPIRTAGSDYLSYAILDSIIDAYFPALEIYSEKLDDLEDAVIDRPHSDLVAEIHDVKRDLQIMRHALWPMREMVNTLMNSQHMADADTRPYLRDCYDHVVQLLDMLETFRERAAGLIDIYLSSISNKMNEVMKVLTIIATIFMPLSFIAGVYGMNFDTSKPLNMPELHWEYGYLFSLGLMSVVAIILMIYFIAKGWLSSGPRKL